MGVCRLNHAGVLNNAAFRDDVRVNRPVLGKEFVFVIDPEDNVLAFPTATALVKDLRRMPDDEREAATYFSLDGEHLDLDGRASHGLWLVHTGRDALSDLRERLAALADDPNASSDPRTVANQVLYNEWLGRWPSKPDWLHRMIWGRAAPTV